MLKRLNVILVLLLGFTYQRGSVYDTSNAPVPGGNLIFGADWSRLCLTATL